MAIEQRFCGRVADKSDQISAPSGRWTSAGAVTADGDGVTMRKVQQGHGSSVVGHSWRTVCSLVSASDLHPGHHLLHVDKHKGICVVEPAV